LQHLDIDPQRVLAIGDAENDVEMLQLVGLGVAMGNAVEHLKAVADQVVASNDEDGVAEAIGRFVL
jgi:hydroxymethylpyrimidine pyrophosphatase-like HAD family hydrolase